MESRGLSSDRSNADTGNGDEAAFNQLNQEVVLGDLIWVRLHGSAFWPAQVVADDTVSLQIKPQSRSVDEVLVRLYGSYKYMYVNPISCRAEFENTLEQNNGNCSEILGETLKQDLTHIRSGGAKGKVSKSGGKATASLRIHRNAKQNIANIQEIEYPVTVSSQSSQYQASASQRILLASSMSQRKVKISNLSSKTNGEGRSRTKDQGEIQKKVDPNSPKSLKVKSSNLSSKTNEEGGSRTQKRGEVQKKVDPNSPKSARISLKRTSARDTPLEFRDDNSYPEKTGEGRSRKRKQSKTQKAEPNSPESARISSRRTRSFGNLQKVVEDGNILPVKTEEKNSKIQKHDAVQRKMEARSPSSTRVSPKRSIPDNAKEAKSKKQKQNRVQKKLKPNHPDSARTFPRRNSAVDKSQTVQKNVELLPEKVGRGGKKKDESKNVVKKVKKSSPSNLGPSTTRRLKKIEDGNFATENKEEVARDKAAKGGGKQEKRSEENLKPGTNLAGKSHQPRRIKVMLNLGLIAPSGSPFHRINVQI